MDARRNTLEQRLHTQKEVGKEVREFVAGLRERNIDDETIKIALRGVLGSMQVAEHMRLLKERAEQAD